MRGEAIQIDGAIFSLLFLLPVKEALRFTAASKSLGFWRREAFLFQDTIDTRSKTVKRTPWCVNPKHPVLTRMDQLLAEERIDVLHCPQNTLSFSSQPVTLRTVS